MRSYERRTSAAAKPLTLTSLDALESPSGGEAFGLMKEGKITI
jgi:hypothetical protein